MAKRRERHRAEGTFLESVSERLSVLETLIVQIHWSAVGQWQQQWALSASLVEHARGEERSADAELVVTGQWEEVPSTNHNDHDVVREVERCIKELEIINNTAEGVGGEDHEGHESLADVNLT